jgi:hypothetical protein
VRRATTAVEVLEAVLKPGSGAAFDSRSSRSAVQTQLAAAKEAAWFQPTPEHYKLLGLRHSCTVDEVCDYTAESYMRRSGCLLQLTC